MQSRLNDKFIDTVYIAVLKLREICETKRIPEAEEVVRQAVSSPAGVRLFFYFCIN